MATLLQIKQMFEAMPDDSALLERKNFREEWTETYLVPDIRSDLARWRWKTDNKVVNLAALIGTGIDCEFWNGEGLPIVISPLISIQAGSTYAYSTTTMTGFLYCRPRYNRWFAWEDISLPEYTSVAEGLNVLGFEFRKNIGSTYMFRITGLQEGWKYPWENEDDSKQSD